MPGTARLNQCKPLVLTRLFKQTVLLILYVASIQNVAAAPTVAVSIKPLQHLVAALTAGVTEPVLILDANQDPHNISLRPSERRALASAALIVWVGPALELPLEEVMSQVKGRVLTLENIEGLTLLQQQGAIDPHLWLDTENAKHIAGAVSRELVQLDPAQYLRYETNLNSFLQSLQQTHEQISATLAAQPLQSWAVYHHAFAYFEAEFALPAALRLKDSDNVEPGVRSALTFNRAMQAEQLDCIVAEPGVNPASVRALLNNQQLKVQTADILGLGLAVSATSFNKLLQDVAAAITSCSGASHE